MFGDWCFKNGLYLGSKAEVIDIRLIKLIAELIIDYLNAFVNK